MLDVVCNYHINFYIFEYHFDFSVKQTAMLQLTREWYSYTNIDHHHRRQSFILLIELQQRRLNEIVQYSIPDFSLPGVNPMFYSLCHCAPHADVLPRTHLVRLRFPLRAQHLEDGFLRFVFHFYKIPH